MYAILDLQPIFSVREPVKILDTDRLHLRPLTVDDTAALHQGVYADPAVCRFFCGQTRTLEEVRERMVYRSFQLRDSSLGISRRGA